MRGKPGEITVFLSLITVCCLSLFLGLVESARTAGARLYLEMAANSAMSSVMSQYNRNLWDMYHLLFLESESEEAVEQSFESYLSFYMEQENLYPMKLEESKIKNISYMTDSGGEVLEKEIASYMKHHLPDIVKEMDDVAEAAGEASKAGDFRQLFDVCLNAGFRTRKLEKCRENLEQCFAKMQEELEKAKDAADGEADGKLEQRLEKLIEEAEQFPGLLRRYREEAECISDYLKDLRAESAHVPENTEAASKWNQEIQAFEQVDKAAQEQLDRYENMVNDVEEIESNGKDILRLLDSDDEDVDWQTVCSILDDLKAPAISVADVENEERLLALDRLETLVSEGFLSLVLLKEEVSANRVSLKGIPSTEVGKAEKSHDPLHKELYDHFAVNEYCIMKFDSYIEEKTAIPSLEEQALNYEMEYLICGNNTDRKNLTETIEALIFVRAAMNLCYLSGTPERKAEADGLAVTLSGGSIPLQVILSFFIFTLWSVGEAVRDGRALLADRGVPFWKTGETWQLSLEQLFSLEFVDRKFSVAETDDACTYDDYLRILCFLMDREEKNARIMDLIQWNVRTKQEDFSVSDCIAAVEIQTRVINRHLFFEKEEYRQIVRVVGKY